MQTAVLMIDFGNTRIKAAYALEQNQIQIIITDDVLHSVKEFLQIQPNIPIAYLRTGKIPESWNGILGRDASKELSTKLNLPIRWTYKTPETLGPDRLAGACAAVAAFPSQPVLYIGMGTALTIDFVDATGVYRGGSISPGLQMRFKALAHFTEKLPEVSITEIPDEFLGDSTANSIRSGVFFGMLAEIKQQIDRFSNQYSDLKVVLTGGDAPLFESKLNSPIFARPNWVFEGLHAVLMYHEQSDKR